MESIKALLARGGAPLRGMTVEALGEGDFFRAYLVDDAWVLRVAKHAEAAAALRRERCLLPRLGAGLPLPVPQPEFLFSGEGADPAFAVHRWLPGPALSREAYLALPEGARERCAGAVGGFLARLHATDLALPRGCGVPEVDYYQRYSALLERAHPALRPRITAEDWTWVEGILTGYLAEDGMPVLPVLLHGDLSPDHVLYDEEAAEVTAVIDFGDLSIGDPAWDLVYLYEDYGVDFLSRVLRAYPADGDPGRRFRMLRYLQLDAVQWAVGSAEEGEEEELAEATAYLRKVRREAGGPSPLES